MEAPRGNYGGRSAGDNASLDALLATWFFFECCILYDYELFTHTTWLLDLYSKA